MLAQPYRLPSTARLQQAKFLKKQPFAVKYAPNGLDVSRFGFVVRKTVDKRSVIRNRIKRVFRSCIETEMQSIHTGYDMLFFLERGIMDKSRDEVCQLLMQSLKERNLAR